MQTDYGTFVNAWVTDRPPILLYITGADTFSLVRVKPLLNPAAFSGASVTGQPGRSTAWLPCLHVAADGHAF
ncbi:hypothetical protein BBG26_25225 [Salmonella enterica]|nr:hypothetical protein [Salmonella enterica]